MQIETLRRLLNDGKIMWTTHCLERMGERDILRADVKNCITHGEIIEDYPSDFPNPSCLILGTSVGGRYLHTVVGCDGEYIYIITAYYPSEDKFEPDMRTRRS